MILLTVSGCVSVTDPVSADLQKRISADNLKRVFELRRLRFAVARTPAEEWETQIIRSAASELGLDLILCRTTKEHLFPLVRAGEADLASGNLSEKEITDSYLEPHTVCLAAPGGKKEKTVTFVMSPGSAELWKLLEKAILSASGSGLLSSGGNQ